MTPRSRLLPPGRQTDPRAWTPRTPHMTEKKLIVAIGGFRLRHPMLGPAFSFFAVPAFMQARRAPGNRFADARFVDGRHFSLSAWESPQAMRAYAVSGPHARAMRAASWLGSGPFARYTADAPPDWDEALAVWYAAHGGEARAATAQGIPETEA